MTTATSIYVRRSTEGDRTTNSDRQRAMATAAWLKAKAPKGDKR